MTPAPRRTKTTREDQKGGTLEEPDVVRSLLLYGTDTQYELSPSFKSITIGADPKDKIRLSADIVSRGHCRVARRWKRVRVYDKGSKNGTWYEGVRERSFDLAPGKTFVVGGLPNRFLALSDVMRKAYPDLQDILGTYDEHVVKSDTPSPSDMIIAAIDGGHLLLTSDRSCGQDRLAEIIHAISRRRTQPPAIVEDVRAPTPALLGLVQGDAVRSTVVFDLGDDKTPVAPDLVAALFSSGQLTRVIALARSVDVAIGALGVDTVLRMQRLWLRPVGMRRQAVPRLLDRILEDLESPLRFSHMTPQNQQALRAYGWPDNFASLRRTAEYLAAVTRTGNTNKAAQALNISPSSVYYLRDKIGLQGRPFTTED